MTGKKLKKSKADIAEYRIHFTFFPDTDSYPVCIQHIYQWE